MTDGFATRLRERAEPAFTDAVEHRFVEELAHGTLPDEVFRHYLVQDYAFLATVTRLTGHALGQAPAADARRELAGALDVLTGDEDDYFERAFDDLGVPEAEWTDPALGEMTEAFDDLLVRAAHEGGYEESLAVLAPAEWIYGAWAAAAADVGEADRWYLTEWVDIHHNREIESSHSRGPLASEDSISDFEAYVEFLRGELDRYGPELSPRREEHVARLFRRTAELEVAFFDQAYAAADDGSGRAGEVA